MKELKLKLLFVCVLMLVGAVPVVLGEYNPWNTVVFRDDFDDPNGSMPDPNKWVIGHPEQPSSCDWTQGRTQFPDPCCLRHREGPLPRIYNGACVIEHRHYNPYEDDITSPSLFLGGEIHTLLEFEPNRCYLFEARVRCNPYPNGLVTSFFTYGDDGSKSDELDFEFVSNKTNQDPNSDPVLVNTWNESRQYPLYAEVPGLNLTEWNTFRIYWLPDQHCAGWSWMDPNNGETWLRTEMNTTYAPDERMALYFSFWASTEEWNDAYNPNLHPVNDPNMNKIYKYDIDYVEVRVPGPRQPMIIYVDTDAPPGGDGKTWHTAFKYLQDALAICVCGDEIRVAEGTHRPDTNWLVPDGSDDRGATFRLKNCIGIHGGYAGYGAPDPNERNTKKYKTILSGDIGKVGNHSDNTYHVVTGSSTDTTAVLDGFVITGGYANHWAYPDDHGAGMLNESGSPTVINCTFIENQAKFGGGMFNYDSNPDVRDCNFSYNVAEGISYSGGGGIANDNGSSPTLTNCIFKANKAYDHGGGLANWAYCNPCLVNCTFSGNKSDSFGGGINNDNRSSPHLTNCIFIGNQADIYGGGMSNWVNCKPELINCTFSSNSAVDAGGALYNKSYKNPILTNCILWGDTGGEISGSASVKYSNVQFGFPGEGNIDANPCFVNPSNADYRLLPDSPCIDEGNNIAVPIDTIDLDGDNDTTEPIPWDLDGNTRIVDGNFDCNRIVDMGAYEFFPAIEVTMKFTPQALNPRSKGNWVKAHFILPDCFVVEDVDAKEPAWIEPFGIESEYINIFVNEDGLVEIEAAFSRAEFCAAGPIAGAVKVIGVLTNGQYFYGTDTITIISGYLRYLAILASHWLQVDCHAPDWCAGGDLDHSCTVDFVDFALFDSCCIEFVKNE